MTTTSVQTELHRAEPLLQSCSPWRDSGEVHVAGSKMEMGECSVLGAGLRHGKAQLPEMKAEEGALEQQERLSCRVGAWRYHGGLLEDLGILRV